MKRWEEEEQQKKRGRRRKLALSLCASLLLPGDSWHRPLASWQQYFISFYSQLRENMAYVVEMLRMGRRMRKGREEENHSWFGTRWVRQILCYVVCTCTLTLQTTNVFLATRWHWGGSRKRWCGTLRHWSSVREGQLCRCRLIPSAGEVKCVNSIGFASNFQGFVEYSPNNPIYLP